MAFVDDIKKCKPYTILLLLGIIFIIGGIGLFIGGFLGVVIPGIGMVGIFIGIFVCLGSRCLKRKNENAGVGGAGAQVTTYAATGQVIDGTQTVYPQAAGTHPAQPGTYSSLQGTYPPPPQGTCPSPHETFPPPQEVLPVPQDKAVEAAQPNFTTNMNPPSYSLPSYADATSPSAPPQ